MSAVARPSGRPLDGEFADYARADIDCVAGDDAVDILTTLARETLALLGALDESRVHGLTYAQGKWTLKEVVGHLADDERIFAYRALCIARNDPRPLPGFDERSYVGAAGFEGRPWADLLADYRAVRKASLSLFRGLDADAWLRRGTVNQYSA
ncbi:MAG TPA: DinB family protein, partial [Gemmatimonadales bacterium]|nr:DinB family protein [Gemmatimonadales bacterium]